MLMMSGELIAKKHTSLWRALKLTIEDGTPLQGQPIGYKFKGRTNSISYTMAITFEESLTHVTHHNSTLK